MNDFPSDARPVGGPSDRAAGLDPDLLRLFDEASVDTHDEAFVAAMLGRLQKARRARLLMRLMLTAAIIVVGALVAPYVAQATLTVMGSFALYPAGGACAALIAWRSARRRFN